MDERIILAYEPLAPGANGGRGRALLFEILHQLTGRRHEERQLVFGSRGRPSLPGAPDFSIAHCAGALVVAVAMRGRVGVDIEPEGRTLALGLRKICDAEEYALAARVGAAYVWVAKEAAIKCLGLSALMAAQVRLWQGHAAVRGAVLHLHRPLLAPGFRVAVASTERFADNAFTPHT